MWYYTDKVNEFGPLDDEQIIELIKDGTIKQGTTVRQDTETAWTTAGKTALAKHFTHPTRPNHPEHRHEHHPEHRHSAHSAKPVAAKKTNDIISTLKHIHGNSLAMSGILLLVAAIAYVLLLIYAR